MSSFFENARKPADGMAQGMTDVLYTMKPVFAMINYWMVGDQAQNPQ